MRVSVIIPALDEEAAIASTIDSVRRALHAGDEVLVVDGGSADRTADLVRASGARLLTGSRGRGRQMNAGAGASS